MALPAITISDFTGEVKIGVDTYALADFDAYIASEYPNIVREVLGQAAYKEIDATNPLPQKWQDVFAGAEWLEPSGSETWARYQEGLRKAAIYRLWFGWMREAGIVSTSTGLVSNLNENATPTLRGDVYAMTGQRWNKATAIINKIMVFIGDNSKIQPEISGASVPAPGTTRIFVDSTLYLAVGDAAIIVGGSFTVSAILADTWIEVAYIFPQTPDWMYWQPFIKYRIPCTQQGFAI